MLEGRAYQDVRVMPRMPTFPGYLRHALIEDLDDPGHLFAISELESREAAGKVLTEASVARSS